MTEQLIFNAASLGETIRLRNLLKECKGDEANAKNARGMTALHVAASMNQKECVDILVQEGKARVHIQDKEGRTALQIAASLGNVGIMDSLVKAGANVDAADRSGATSLMIVCEMMAQSSSSGYGASSGSDGDLRKAAQWLVEKGASINERNNSGRTALMLACKSKDAALVRLLLQHGADTKRKDNLGASVLDFAEGDAQIKSLLQ